MKIWTQQEEADALRRRFEDLKEEKKSRAWFAEEFELRGGDSMIYQHITCRRPINMEHAIAYARGFRCSIEEISPRLAVEARKSACLLPSSNTNAITNLEQSAPQAANVSPFANRRSEDHPAIAAVVKLMMEMDDVGKGRLLERATVIAEQHAKANPAKLSQ